MTIKNRFIRISAWKDKKCDKSHLTCFWYRKDKVIRILTKTWAGIHIEYKRYKLFLGIPYNHTE